MAPHVTAYTDSQDSAGIDPISVRYVAVAPTERCTAATVHCRSGCYYYWIRSALGLMLESRRRRVKKLLRRRRAQREVDRVLNYWFSGDVQTNYHQKWFSKRGSTQQSLLDATVHDEFKGLVQRAVADGLRYWDRCGSMGTLARIIVCDQLARHLHREDPIAQVRLDHHAVKAARRLDVQVIRQHW